jgi:hypothetical protein
MALLCPTRPAHPVLQLSHLLQPFCLTDHVRRPSHNISSQCYTFYLHLWVGQCGSGGLPTARPPPTPTPIWSAINFPLHTISAVTVAAKCLNSANFSHDTDVSACSHGLTALLCSCPHRTHTPEADALRCVAFPACSHCDPAAPRVSPCVCTTWGRGSDRRADGGEGGHREGVRLGRPQLAGDMCEPLFNIIPRHLGFPKATRRSFAVQRRCCELKLKLSFVLCHAYTSLADSCLFVCLFVCGLRGVSH